MANISSRTYVEDVKNPDEVLLPCSNPVLIALGEDKSMYRIPFALIDDLPLDIGQSSIIENVGKYISWRGHYRNGSRSQLRNRVEDGLVKLIQSPSLQFSVEYLAYISASPSKVDVILIVSHRVLG